jgi:hypothetical protein
MNVRIWNEGRIVSFLGIYVSNFWYSVFAVKDFMYRRLILCTLYGAVDFLNVLKKSCWWGGGCYWYIVKYVPIGDGWGEVLVHNVLHYVPVLHPGHKQ